MSEETRTARKTGMLAPLLTVVAGGGTALLVSWLDPLGDRPSGEARADDASAEVEGHAAGHGAEASQGSLVRLDPLVISLVPPAGTRRTPMLRVAVALQAEASLAAGLRRDDPRLRDGFTAEARAIGPDVLAGAEGLEALRAAFLGRARTLLGEEAVEGVLITDYVLR